MKETIKTIFARRSIRKYTKEPVSKEDLKTLLEVAMAAPSASNRQPWNFIAVTDRKTLNKLAEAHSHGKMLNNAPLCITVCGDTSIAERFWVQDCSAATQNILVGVTALSLGAVWLGVYPRKERIKDVKEILNIPEGITPLCLISIGHPDEEKEPRTQYIEEKVHQEKW